MHSHRNLGRKLMTIVEYEASGGNRRYALTIASSELVLQTGVPKHLIVGWLETLEPVIELKNFRPNEEFVNHLQTVVGNCGVDCPKLQMEAQKLGSGIVYVIDLRTSDIAGAIPPRDIIGAFVVRDGKVQAGSYQANPNYEILTQQGFFTLDPFLANKLL